MSKSKEVEPEVKSITLEDYQKIIEKKFGAGAAISASEVCNKEKWLVPVSPSLDIGLLGGIPSGSWVMISGKEKLGKTALALQIARNAQKAYGSKIIYINAEGRFKEQNTRAIDGLNLDGMMVIETSIDTVMYGEEMLEAAEEAIKNFYGCVIIIDSINRLYPGDQAVKDVSGSKRSGTPKLLSDFCSRMGGIVPARNAIVICIAQVYDNVTGYGAGKIVGGGNSVKFQGDVIMHGKKVTPWEEVEGEKKTLIGNHIEWDIIQNAIGQPPSELVSNYLRYGYGADETKEIISLALDFGLIAKKGSWFMIEEEKFQGEKKIYEFLKEHPDVEKTLLEQIKGYALDPNLTKNYTTNIKL